jgi:hypothetical protein
MKRDEKLSIQIEAVEAKIEKIADDLGYEVHYLMSGHISLVPDYNFLIDTKGELTREGYFASDENSVREYREKIATLARQRAKLIAERNAQS